MSGSWGCNPAQNMNLFVKMEKQLPKVPKAQIQTISLTLNIALAPILGNTSPGSHTERGERKWPQKLWGYSGGDVFVGRGEIPEGPVLTEIDVKPFFPMRVHSLDAKPTPFSVFPEARWMCKTTLGGRWAQRDPFKSGAPGGGIGKYKTSIKRSSQTGPNSSIYSTFLFKLMLNTGITKEWQTCFAWTAHPYRTATERNVALTLFEDHP